MRRGGPAIRLRFEDYKKNSDDDHGADEEQLSKTSEVKLTAPTTAAVQGQFIQFAAQVVTS